MLEFKIMDNADIVVNPEWRVWTYFTNLQKEKASDKHVSRVIQRQLTRKNVVTNS